MAGSASNGTALGAPHWGQPPIATTVASVDAWPAHRLIEVCCTSAVDRSCQARLCLLFPIQGQPEHALLTAGGAQHLRWPSLSGQADAVAGLLVQRGLRRLCLMFDAGFTPDATMESSTDTQEAHSNPLEAAGSPAPLEPLPLPLPNVGGGGGLPQHMKACQLHSQAGAAFR